MRHGSLIRTGIRITASAIFYVVGKLVRDIRQVGSFYPVGRPGELYQGSNGAPPIFFTFVPAGDGKDIGFYHWPFGPFEYRDRKTGEWKWCE
jgi:hypothetical protein